MELHKKSVKGSWAKNENFDNRFFIINEAIVEKLCILGTNFEPCFEGSQIKVSFSLDEDFNQRMYSMMDDLKNALEKGGSEESMEHNDVIETIDVETPAVNENPEEVVDEIVEVEPEVVEDPIVEENPVEDPEVVEDPETEEVPVQAEFNLEENEEYLNLKKDYEDLQSKFAALEQENTELKAEIGPLQEFKLHSERAAKQEMIDKFYMLNEEEKADVIANIDTYSLDDIEAKLSVICVRNKVNFNAEEDANAGLVYNLNNAGVVSSMEGLPAWVQAVKRTASQNK